MNNQSFVLKVPADSNLFQRLLELDSEFSLVQTENRGLIYSADLSSLVRLVTELEPSEYEIETLREEVWRDNWSANLDPVDIESLGMRFVAHDEDFLLSKNFTPNEIGLYPGRSFGVGHHETTRITLELMGRHKTVFQNSKVLDFGCGSGILGIVASRLGADKILAVDIDPEALRVTEINAGLNRIDNLTCSSEPHGSFDLVLMNTLPIVIEEEFPKIIKLLASDAKIFVSGFLVDQQPSISKLLSLTEKDSLQGQEWGSLFGIRL